MRALLLALLVAFINAPSPGQEAETQDGPGPERLEILSPLPDSVISGEDLLELSLLLPPMDGLSLSLWLDGTDVTRQSEITPDYAFYLSPSPLAPGRHDVLALGIVGEDTLFSEAWSFTVFQSAAVPETAFFPWEGSLGLGWQYGKCGRDTSGLGLASPVGHQISGEASFHGPLWGGLAHGHLGYDPAYDPGPHGLVQLSRGRLELSLGEFYPDLSSLAFADAIPLGLLGRVSFLGLTLDFTACRTATADTTVSTFAQYLYGGRAGIRLGDSLSFGLGYLQGQDQASSLPDSVRYRTTTMILSDTIFGLTDTLVYADTLRPAGNRIGWLSVKKTFGPYSIDFEAAGTRTISDGGVGAEGWGYLARAGRFSPAFDFILTYSSTDARFRSFGSPYLETFKNELEWQLQAGWPGKARSVFQGGVYKAFADSADGLSWRFGAGWNLRNSVFSNLSLRLDYNMRPYREYLSQSRGFSAGLGFSALGAGLNASYGYNSSSSPGSTQSHNLSAEVSRPLYRRSATVTLGHQYYQTRSASGSSDLDKHSLTVAVSGDLISPLSYRLHARHIAQTDRAEPDKSYRQNLVSAGLSWRF